MFSKTAVFTTLFLVFTLLTGGCSKNASLGLGTIETPSHLQYFESSRRTAVVITFLIKNTKGEEEYAGVSGFAVGPHHVITSLSIYEKFNDVKKVSIHTFDPKTNEISPTIEVVSQVTNRRNKFLLFKTKTRLPHIVTFPKRLKTHIGAEIHSVDFVSFDKVYPGQIHLGHVSAVYEKEDQAPIVFADILVSSGSPGSPIHNERGELVGMLMGPVKDPSGKKSNDQRAIIRTAAEIVEFLDANDVKYRQAKR